MKKNLLFATFLNRFCEGYVAKISENLVKVRKPNIPPSQNDANMFLFLVQKYDFWESAKVILRQIFLRVKNLPKIVIFANIFFRDPLRKSRFSTPIRYPQECFSKTTFWPLLRRRSMLKIHQIVSPSQISILRRGSLVEKRGSWGYLIVVLIFGGGFENFHLMTMR